MSIIEQLAEHDHWFFIAKGWELGLIMGIGVCLALQRMERWWMARKAAKQITRRMKRWNER
jgi:hypothetical protein